MSDELMVKDEVLRRELQKFDRGNGWEDWRWLVHGEDATVQFLVGGMVIPEGSFSSESGAALRELFPMPADLGVHSDVQVFESMYESDECDVRGTPRCFYDGSGMHAARVWATVKDLPEAERDEAIYTELERTLRLLAEDLAQSGIRGADGR